MRQSPSEQCDAQTADEVALSARLMNNRSMPANAVIPVLNYPDMLAAVDWLCKAFGFRERLRVADHRSQLQLGMAGEGIVVRQGPKPSSSIDSTKALDPDRKSTRLNSSHPSTSYAVFCLKKKNAHSVHSGVS